MPLTNRTVTLPHAQRAFSLVELSIVLVILGLLVGGVLSGQSLIRAAEVRAISTEYSRWQTATQSFRDKYFAIPGDMANATKFWGAADPTPATCLTTAGTGTQTCDGNGDGKLSNAAAASQYGEWTTFWQHLANAGLIEGTYTGMAGAAAAVELTTANSPKGKIGNAIWMVSNDASSGGAMFPVAVARHNFRIGVPVATTWPFGKLLKPEELWNIDTKLDDGLPGQGIVTATLSSYGNVPNCSSTSVASTAVYRLDLSSKECIGFFASGF